MGFASITRGGLKLIHVNINNIRHNAKHSDTRPVARVQGTKGGFPIYGDEVAIIVDGKTVAKLVYRPNDPLPCGAKVWIETTERVEVYETRQHDESSCPLEVQ